MKDAKKYIIKRKGYKEGYDEKKVYASCYGAAINCNYSERRAEKLALTVTKAMNKWVSARFSKKKQISSEDIRDQILYHLEDNEVAFMYKHHLDLC